MIVKGAKLTCDICGFEKFIPEDGCEEGAGWQEFFLGTPSERFNRIDTRTILCPRCAKKLKLAVEGMKNSIRGSAWEIKNSTEGEPIYG